MVWFRFCGFTHTRGWTGRLLKEATKPGQLFKTWPWWWRFRERWHTGCTHIYVKLWMCCWLANEKPSLLQTTPQYKAVIWKVRPLLALWPTLYRHLYIQDPPKEMLLLNGRGFSGIFLHHTNTSGETSGKYWIHSKHLTLRTFGRHWSGILIKAIKTRNVKRIWISDMDKHFKLRQIFATIDITGKISFSW